jgi:hypothetical protein
MQRRKLLVALGSVVLIGGGVTGGFALSASGAGSAATAGCSDTPNPDGTVPCAGSWSVDVTPPTETVPGPTITETVTVTAPTPTPTITPTTTTPPQTLNCLPSPHLCGFPDATNTGVPAGTTLTPYTGPTSITTAGTVIDGQDIHGPLFIRAGNVTVKNSRIYLNSSNVSGQNVALFVKPGADHFSISHTEVTGNLGGQSYCISAVANDAFAATIDTVDMHGCGDGIRGGDYTATNSYLHGFWFGQINGVNVDTPHADCFQGLYGDSNVLLDHDTCNNPNDAPPPGSPGYSNSVIQLGTEGNTPATNWTMRRSLVQGGGLSINMQSGLATGMTWTNNQWGRDYAYGLIGSGGHGGYTWSGNVWDDTGAVALAQPG